MLIANDRGAGHPHDTPDLQLLRAVQSMPSLDVWAYAVAEPEW